MKKMIKKVSAFFLAALMAMSLSVPVFAEGDGETPASTPETAAAEAALEEVSTYNSDAVKTYTITIDYNDGVTQPATFTKQHDVRFYFPEETPQRDGYEFVSYERRDSEGNGRGDYYPGSGYSRNEDTVFVVTWTLAYRHEPDKTGFYDDAAMDAVFAKINETRVDAGLPVLKYREDVQYAADILANELADKDGKIGYLRPNGFALGTAMVNYIEFKDYDFIWNTSGLDFFGGYSHKGYVDRQIVNPNFTGVAISLYYPDVDYANNATMDYSTIDSAQGYYFAIFVGDFIASYNPDNYKFPEARTRNEETYVSTTFDSFVLNDAQKYPSYLKSGNTYTITPPERAGYNFLGWTVYWAPYINTNRKTEFEGTTFTTPLATEVTPYEIMYGLRIDARWEKATTPTPSPVATPTVKPTATPTATPKPTATPTATPKPTAVPTATPKPTASATPRPTATPTATPKPTATPTATPKPTAAPTATPTATPKPTATPTATPKPTVVPTATPKPTATPTATPKPTATPTATPKPTAAPTATPKPTAAPTPAPTATPKPNYSKDVDGFVTRLYNICLNRTPDTAGLADWTGKLNSKSISGADAAMGFIFSKEFKGNNYCNECYVKTLYNAFFGREADKGGLADWVGRLEGGATREEVFNGFVGSDEFSRLCTDYGINRGNGMAVPQYGTVPTGNCVNDGTVDGVTAFVTRMYQVALNRTPDPAGLKDWTNRLWNHTASGRDIGSGFIFSVEFKNKNYSNADYVERLYQAFMGRASDAPGKADWVNQLNNGASREHVFNGFANSQEFTKICNSYGIVRG